MMVTMLYFIPELKFDLTQRRNSIGQTDLLLYSQRKYALSYSASSNNVDTDCDAQARDYCLQSQVARQGSTFTGTPSAVFFFGLALSSGLLSSFLPELKIIPACSWCQASLVGARIARAAPSSDIFRVNAEFLLCSKRWCLRQKGTLLFVRYPELEFWEPADGPDRLEAVQIAHNVISSATRCEGTGPSI